MSRRAARIEEDVVALARDLIAIESHALARGREAAVAEYLAGWFRARGVETELLPAVGDRANLVARASFGAGPTLLLNGHLDTVPAGEMQDAFAPRIESGILHGRGACDMKGAVAAMACALLACEADDDGRRALRGTLVFAGTVDEETGSQGVKRLLESGVTADAAVVGEPTDLRLAIAHKGACFVRVRLTGRGAHGSCPQEGTNAASYGARVVAALEDHLQPQLARRSYPLLGPATLCVGRICGGTEPNIVAERCEIDIDRRTLPGEHDALREIVDVVERVCANVPGLTVEVYETERTAVVPHVALGTPPEAPIAQAAAAACRALGLADEPVGVTYWTDGAHLAANGIETIVLGPGKIADAHGPRDQVRVADLVTAVAMYSGIGKRMLSAS
ncbi:MAG: M20/M25/M40 family metallo-hydrolase [Candidatus Bipolaricaulota bacterium]